MGKGFVVREADPEALDKADKYVNAKNDAGHFDNLSGAAVIENAQLEGVDLSSRGMNAHVSFSLDDGDSEALKGEVERLNRLEEQTKVGLESVVTHSRGSFSREVSDGKITTGLETTIAFNESADLGSCVPGQMSFDRHGKLEVDVSKADAAKLEDVGCVTDNRVEVAPMI